MSRFQKCECNCNCESVRVKGENVCPYNDEIWICGDCWFHHEDYCDLCPVCMDHFEDKKTEEKIEKMRGY